MKDIATQLVEILSLERRPEPNWQEISRRCDTIIETINTEGLKGCLGTIVYRFCEDYDVRQKSQEYAEWQRDELKKWLSIAK